MKDIKEQMESKGFNVKLDEEQWVLRLDLPLFASCGVKLKNEGKRTIQALGQVMYAEFIKNEYKKILKYKEIYQFGFKKICFRCEI